MKDNWEELSARARRQELSAPEARQLDLLLESSSEARLWHHAGSEFDAEDVVLPGDHEATERVIQRLLKRAPPRRAHSRARFFALLVAAAVLVISVAAAALVGVRVLSRRLGPPALPATSPPSALLPQTAPRVPLPAPTVPPEAPPSSASAPEMSAGASSNEPSAAPSTTAQTAAELLSAAGQARRQGYSARAIGLLDELQARYPTSPEARSSDITLGMLQLKRGAAGPALTHFDRYLQRSPQGPLASEALWGKAQASFAGGNDAAGRSALSALLTRYPSSPYASAARAKLGASAP